MPMWGVGGGVRSLKEARALLDQQHYGLDKVKARWVGGWVGGRLLAWPPAWLWLLVGWLVG